MLNSKLIVLIIIIIFFLINKKLFSSVLKTITTNEKEPKQIILFNKKIQKQKHKKIFKYFKKITITIIIMFLIYFLFPPDLNQINFKKSENQCLFDLINESETKSLNCNNLLLGKLEEINIIHQNERRLNENNPIKVTIYGNFNHAKTKKVVNKILEFNKNNIGKISYSFVPVAFDEEAKKNYCIYAIDSKKYWAYHTAIMKYESNDEKIKKELYKELDLNEDLIWNCVFGNFPFEERKNDEKLIKETKIFAIPTTFIDNKLYVGEIDLKKHFYSE